MAKHTKGPWAPAIYTVTDTMIERLKSGPQAALRSIRKVRKSAV